MSAAQYVISLGEALWDVFIRPDGSYTRCLGGAPANFACLAAQHGLPARVVSAIGYDAAGNALSAALAEAGVPCDLQRVPCATGEVGIELDSAGVPHYHIHANAAWDHITPTPELLALARQTRAVCFGSLAQRSEVSRATIDAFLKAMPQGEEQLKVFDINLRCGYYTHTVIRDALRQANVLKINEDEMEILARMERFCGHPQLEQARSIVLRYGLHLLILTCGAIGSYVLGADGEPLSFLTTPAVEVVDTVGAGDSFTATFIAGLLHGLTVPEAHAAAVQVSAWVCTQKGATPVLPEHLRLNVSKV